MQINRNEIRRYYENIIDDIENEDVRENLLDNLEEIDDLLLLLESNIEKELENQESDYLPSPNEMWNEFEYGRKEIML